MKRVGLVFGSRSVEHEISVTTASKAYQAFAELRAAFEPVPLYIAKSGAWLTGPAVERLLSTEAEGRAAEEPARRKTLAEEYKRQLHALQTGAPDGAQQFLSPDPTLKGLVGNPERAGWFRKTLGAAIDIAFPLVHGTHGEDGTLQGLFELADLPYVGPGVAASAVGMDKILSKLVFRGAGLPTLDAAWFTRRQVLEDDAAAAREVEARLGFPVVVKPAVAGSSVGIARATDAGALSSAISQAMQFSARVLVERAVDERIEVQCAVLGNHAPQVSALEELVQSAGIVSFEEKYLRRPADADLAASVIPARVPADLAAEVTALARQAFDALDARGISRVDFLVDRATMRPYVNEVNTLPGSLCLRLWEASGLRPAKVVERLLELAEEAHADKARTRYESREGAGLVDRKHLMSPGK